MWSQQINFPLHSANDALTILLRAHRKSRSKMWYKRVAVCWLHWSRTAHSTNQPIWIVAQTDQAIHSDTLTTKNRSQLVQVQLKSYLLWWLVRKCIFVVAATLQWLSKTQQHVQNDCMRQGADRTEAEMYSVRGQFVDCKTAATNRIGSSYFVYGWRGNITWLKCEENEFLCVWLFHGNCARDSIPSPHFGERKKKTIRSKNRQIRCITEILRVASECVCVCASSPCWDDNQNQLLRIDDSRSLSFYL